MINSSLYSFGGFGYLWKYDINTEPWIWVSGSNTSGQVGNYGTQNVFSSSNVPVARNGAISWSDSKTIYGYLEDLIMILMNKVK